MRGGFRIIGLIAVAVALAGPAAGQTTLQKPDCNDATIATTEAKIDKMKDGAQKTTAAGEIAAARQSLAQKNTDLCQDHLLKAEFQTK